MIVLQLLLYCLLFTAMVKIAVIGGAVNGLYFYPKEVQDRAIELGLIDRNTMNRKRKCRASFPCPCGLAGKPLPA